MSTQDEEREHPTDLKPGDLVALGWGKRIALTNGKKPPFRMAVFHATSELSSLSAYEFFEHGHYRHAPIIDCIPGDLFVLLDGRTGHAKLLSSEHGVVFTSLVALRLKKV